MTLSVDAVRNANLHFFLADRWNPEFAAWQDTAREGPSYRYEAVSYADLSLLESFLWLDLGAEYGFFSREMAEAIAKDSRDTLSTAYSDVVRRKQDQKFEPDLQRRLQTCLQHGLGLTRERDLPFVAAEAFRPILTLSNGLAELGDARSFFRVAIFGNPRTWEGVKLAFETEEGEEATIIRGFTSAGVLASIDFMTAYRELEIDIRATKERPNEILDWQRTVFRHARAVQRWRLAFQDQLVLQRFIEASDYVVRRLARTSGTKTELSERDFERLIEVVNANLWSLLEDWGAQRGKTAFA